MKRMLCWLLGGALAWGQSAPHPQDGQVCRLPLGVRIESGRAVFRVFAPGAEGVRVHIYAAPEGGLGRAHGMRRNPDGSWEVGLAGVGPGDYYTYSAYGPGRRSDLEVPDPYATCVTAADGRALIENDTTPIAARPGFPAAEAVVYELHLRDFSLDPDSGIQRRGKYLGLVEPGTRLWQQPQVRTGLDHLLELGINTVQIMPFSEFASAESEDRYGWGYDAALWMSPEGWYASRPWGSSRVREARQMVDGLHRHGIRVVMDLVLNHTEEGLRRRGFALEALAPGYYYRRRLDGSYWNGSGCGNEIRSEAPMARRLLKDVVRHWVEAYKVDGFRFDLLGLTDRRTVLEIVQELRALDPRLLIYGEPWAAGETPIPVATKGSQRGQGYAVFNDHFRDALKGSVFQAQAGGFVQGMGQAAAVRLGMAGSIDDFAAEPLESVNYVECHDNHTLWDRLANSLPECSAAERERVDRLAAALLLTSQGVPFLHSGQEWLRSKNGNENSYDQPDAMNMLRWRQKVEHGQTVDYYRGLIGLRRSHPLLRQSSAASIRRSLRFLDSGEERWIVCEVRDPDGQDSWARALLVFNADPAARPWTPPAGRWLRYVDAERAGPEPLGPVPDRVEGRSALILGEPR